jgi:exodeoxyribonuclease VII small subunit
MNDDPLDRHSFNAAYEVLKNNAVLLSHQQEPDIDQLLPLVEESIKAYNICKARLEAVQQALEKKIGAAASEHDPMSSQER